MKICLNPPHMANRQGLKAFRQPPLSGASTSEEPQHPSSVVLPSYDFHIRGLDAVHYRSLGFWGAYFWPLIYFCLPPALCLL